MTDHRTKSLQPGTFRPETIHADLGGEFFDLVEAARFPEAILRHRDQRWAERVGLGGLSDAEWVRHFAGFEPLPGSFPQPLALRYHGHQFQTYNPDLGDGRGFLFAQLRDLQDGRLLDLGTKGSGQTPYSRFGDGRLTLKGGMREILATEMLEALGVETSKSFSLIETGEALQRNDEPSPTRSSVLVRLSHSHIRIGTFQRQAYLDKPGKIRRLVSHCVTHYLHESADEPPAFLAAVLARVARLGAQWMAAGFVHGVLNTDNINITGESFDYGPWRFLPHYDPLFTAAYFDQTQLYAYGRQPSILKWNLDRLAECLTLVEPAIEKLQAVLDTYQDAYRVELTHAMFRRLGIQETDSDSDLDLLRALFDWLRDSQTPFERLFFDWYGGRLRRPSDAYPADLAERFGRCRPRPGIRLDHPYFAGEAPCTMLIDEVEAIWAPIAESDDWSRFHAKIAEIRLMGEALESTD